MPKEVSFNFLKEESKFTRVAIRQFFFMLENERQKENYIYISKLNDLVDEKITDKQMEYLKLYLFGFVSIDEIAEMYDVRPSTVSRTIYRAVRNIMWIIEINASTILNIITDNDEDVINPLFSDMRYSFEE